MSGRRLLDAAAMLKAARGVASKYTALQRHQLDIYGKTSSLTKAFKATRYQTGQGTLKGGAGSAGVTSSGQDSKEHTPVKGTRAPSRTSTSGGRKQIEKNSSLEHDHFYTKSEANTTAQPLPDIELSVKQDKAKRYPLPDGSIPPTKYDISIPKHDQDTLSEKANLGSGEDSLVGKSNGTNRNFQSALPSGTSISDQEAKAEQSISDRTRELQRNSENQIPSVSAEPLIANLQPEVISQDSVAGRHPVGLEQDVSLTHSSKATPELSSLRRVEVPEVIGNTQGGHSHILDDRISQDVFYSVPSKNRQEPVPKVQAVPEQGQPSDDMYFEIFHSPRVARLMKGESKHGNAANDLELRAVSDTPVEQAKPSREKDQESFNIRSTGQDPATAVDHYNVTKESTSSKKADAGDSHKLAEAMAQDVANTSSAKPEVGIEIHLSCWVLADKLTVIL